MDTQEFGDEAARWAQRIGACWKRTIAGIIETGRLLIEAKKELNHGEWGYMFTEAVADPLPFEQDTAAILMRIAKSPILANSDKYRKLPIRLSTLYELARLPNDILEAGIEKVRPAMTRDEIKELLPRTPTLKRELRSERPPDWDEWFPEPEWWSAPNIIAATRKFATKQLRSCPRGQEHLVGHILRAIAHEILTPLPQEIDEHLHLERERLLAVIDDVLHDRRVLCGWIRSEGGLKRGDLKGEFEGIPGGVARQIFRTDGRALDDLALSLAGELGRPNSPWCKSLKRSVARATGS